MTILCQSNYRFWLKLTIVYFFIQFLVRGILISELPNGFIETLDTVVDGAMWDLGAWTLLSIPLMLFSLFASTDFHKKFFGSVFDHLATFIFSFIFLFIGFCELVFWNEFHSR